MELFLCSFILHLKIILFYLVPWGSYFNYLSEWNKYAADENVMTITYEELKEVRLPMVRNTES